jgi:hypothetical protein
MNKEIGNKMKLKEYIKKIEILIKENPEALECDLVYSIDDEGNCYNKVSFGPFLGSYADDEFNTICEIEEKIEDALEDDEDLDESETKDWYPINSVCIN